MWFKKKKNPIPLGVDCFTVLQSEKDRIKEGLRKRNLTGLDVISIETHGDVITVWYRSDFTVV